MLMENDRQTPTRRRPEDRTLDQVSITGTQRVVCGICRIR
ncbi:hypothetical protein STXM2123_4372 [Streptomyces sp. F-3]|nr:hypothetical protein STXM2123_4372 [Streptomyces sp. F-3]